MFQPIRTEVRWTRKLESDLNRVCIGGVDEQVQVLRCRLEQGLEHDILEQGPDILEQGHDILEQGHGT